MSVDAGKNAAPMERGPHDALDSLLCGALRGVLSRVGITHFDDGEMARVMREVVRSADLDEAERGVLDADPDPEPDVVRARTDGWIELRMQRALRAAVERAASERGIEPPPIPRVIVARAAQSSASPDLRVDAGTAEASPCTKSIAASPEDVLVLADAGGVDRFLERHSSLWIGDKNVRLRFRAGLDDRRQTVGLAPDPGEDGVEVIEATTVLRDMEDVLERARRELGTCVDVDAPPAAEATDQDLSGSILGGKYELVQRVGRGGFGSVYRARDLRLDHFVAVKILNREGRSLAALAALREEARRLTRIDHPNIVDWKTFDEAEDGTGYIVMELLEGEDLEEIIRREKRLPPRRVAHMLHEIAQALCAAHTLGDGGSILHLDLKPRNVFVLTSTDARGLDRVKVIDFGIAQHGVGGAPRPDDPIESEIAAPAVDRHADGLVEDADGTIRSLQAAALPAVGGSSRATACTPEYAAPEHVAHLLPDIAAVPLDGRADVYSLGVIAYQLLTGELPFAKVTKRRRDLLRIKTTTAADPVSSTGVPIPRDLARFVDRCLQRDRNARFASAEEACEALRRIVTRSAERRWLAVAVASICLSAVFVWSTWGTPGLRAVGAFVASADGEHTLAGRRLCFGPNRTAIDVRIEDAGPDLEARRARLVASCDLEAPELPGTSVAFAGTDLVRIHAGESAGAAAQGAYLEIVGADGVPRYSDAFSLLFVPKLAIEIESAGVEGLGGRALDPRGARLDVHLTGRVDLIDRVVVGDGPRSFEARPDEARTRADGAVWTLDPALFGGHDGHRSLYIEVVDAANGVRDVRVELDFAVSSSSWTIGCDAPRFGDRWSLTPRTGARVRLSANKRSDFDWSVVTESGITLASGHESATTNAHVDLGSVLANVHESFDGFFECSAGDDAYVLHAVSSREAPRRVPIQFRTNGASVRAWIEPCPGRAEVELDGVGIVHTSCRSLDLRIARTCEQPVRYEITVAREGAALRAVAPVRGELADRIRASNVVPIAWDEDGAYAIRLRAWSLESSVEDGALEPEFESTTTIVVTSVASRLLVAGPRNVVIGPESDGILRIDVRAARGERSTSASIAPVDCRWRLIAPGAREIATSGPNAGTLIGGASASLAIALPIVADSATDPADLDGAWRIEVAGTDAAGNEATPAVFAFHVARSGPRIELLMPLATTPWTRGASGFELRVAARDANGVESVRCLLQRVDRQGDELACELTRDGASSVGTLWRGNFDLPLSWSRSEVKMRIEAVDGYGLESASSARRMLARIEAELPERIRVEFAGRAISPMRLVRGNAGSVYVFGGRGDDLENDLFRRAGLSAFNALQTGRSWRIEMPPDSIADYYLDEHEVTAQEFAEFVHSSDGYANPRNWPDGYAPDSARLASWLDALTGVDTQMPVTDVRWSEAAAYAHWVGKGLPSALEWEHALRGGASYRPFASWDPAHPGIRPRFLSADMALPANALDDVAQDTGIGDLSGNVSEWTSTPAHADVPIVDPTRAVGAAPVTRYWVAGGSFASARRDFSTFDRRRVESSAPTVGFRCRLAASDFLARLEDSDEPMFRSFP